MQLRNPDEVNKEEYNEFYKKTFHDYLEPLASSHFATEVTHFPSDNILFVVYKSSIWCLFCTPFVKMLLTSVISRIQLISPRLV